MNESYNDHSMNQVPIQSPLAFFEDPDPLSQERGYADILLPLPFGESFEYAYPLDSFEIKDIHVGSIVRVPFGKREMIGIVHTLKDTPTTPPAKLKSVLEVMEWCHLSKADVDFMGWMADYTLMPMGQIVKMHLSTPDAFQAEKATYAYGMNPDFQGALSAKQHHILTYFQSHPGLHKSAELKKALGISSPSLTTLVKKGALTLLPATESPPRPNPHHSTLTYSPAQKEVIEALVSAVKGTTYKTLLLDGVTGSGKTEVYFEAIAQAIRQGQQTIVLLPEISLTPQWLERFEKHFGTHPVRWHSQMTAAQRRKAWRQAATGEALVIVGARSALHLPCPKLGLLIVDEEHEGSYKQEEGGIYHARDMAVAKAFHKKIPLILVSATPSLESYVNALEGKYTLLKLPDRFGNATLPELALVNMRSHVKGPAKTPQFLAPILRTALTEAFEKGEQSLLFLNRRGYAPLTLCRCCGERMQCPNCTAWLVQHNGIERLQCHHCGFVTRRPKNCTNCNEPDSYIACGPGVERIADEVRLLLPKAKLLIMASDAFQSTTELVHAIESIQRGDVDVIIGTQMMAKGHHFPKLTLVGIVDADLGLAGGDLRACEKTFQLLQQVSGRCGRSEQPGQVYVQTYHPEHPVLKALIGHDKDTFLTQEIEMRRVADMPPFSRLAALILSGPDGNAVEAFARTLLKRAPKVEGRDLHLLGPAQAPLAVLRRQHRWRFLIKAPKGFPMQTYISKWLGILPAPKNIKIQVDIDPISFL